MNNILKFPSSTQVGKPVPKTAFYKHLEVNSKMKQHFVDDVSTITWQYKLAPSTINVADGSSVHEITVFSVLLKKKDCPDDVFIFIDKYMPRHVVFVLEYQDQCKLMLNYKEWTDPSKGTFRIVKTFATEWTSPDNISLALQGQTLDNIYESIAGQISGFGTSTSDETKRIVQLQAMIEKSQREAEALQRKIRNERQFNRQVELNGQARDIKKQIALWQDEINKLKK